jgi:hypothetical protein
VVRVLIVSTIHISCEMSRVDSDKHAYEKQTESVTRLEIDHKTMMMMMMMMIIIIRMCIARRLCG